MIGGDAWYDGIAGITDFLGILGGLLLAWPFWNTQPERDLYISIDSIDSPFPEDAGEFKALKKELARMILKVARRDYRIGCLGALLIAYAFIGKFIATTQSLAVATVMGAFGLVIGWFLLRRGRPR